ncbi:MAG: DUF5696 domain-containing protein [Verrucomicrobia bacterium]|nr:DUF5696 domain-containing protein [Verrucomicrobiota bacterium]
MMNVRFFLLMLSSLCLPTLAGENVITNGGFESGLGGWHVWSRAAAAITATLDAQMAHQGKAALRLEHRGEEDWSLEPALRMSVQPGDEIELECWVKVEGGGTATLCASTWDTQGKAVAWSYGERSAREGTDWQHLKTRVVVPANIAQIQPRLIGYGPTTVRVDDYAAAKRGNLAAMRPANLPGTLTFRNKAIEVTFNTTNATVAVFHSQAGRRWTQKPFSSDCIVKNASIKDQRLQCTLFHGGTGLDLSATMQLEGEQPELVVELSAQGEMPVSIRFPHPFAGEPGDYLVVPMNEGISYPVDDPTISPIHLIAYGGHGICMAFHGVTDGVKGQMAIIETPDDASMRVDRVDGKLAIVPEWDPQRGQFGYARKLRYVFFDQGGHVAMAKRYRAYARQTGLLKTLEEKRKVNPNVDLLIGAVNVWCWDRNSVPLVRDLQTAGIERILWSNAQTPENLKTLNELGVLTSRYDIYQDVMAPTNFPRLRWIHGDWTTKAWPNDIILDRNGKWIKGWGVEAKDGGMIPCGVICDKRAPDYARERVPADQATHPYRCRFIDTTTAAPWHECYHPDHPMTRTESKKWKMELLRYISEDNKLVTGCETGHDASVPFLHYFEGMMSLGPYRVPDSGRRMSEIVTNVPERVAKFQLGQNYRLPLWELVYHDCVVAQWYWGDYNNKLPSLWDKRDLFNVLYGVPPMFMFTKALWEQNKARFVQSYQNTCPHVRKVGYQEMTDHRFLTQDRNVQQTVFANGITITVNFGSTDYKLPDGAVVKAMGYKVKQG